MLYFTKCNLALSSATKHKTATPPGRSGPAQEGEEEMTARQCRNILLGTTMMWSAMLAAPALAQQSEPDADAAAQSGEKGNYGEIVVTGDRANLDRKSTRLHSSH